MAQSPAGKFKLELTPLPTRVSRLAVTRLNGLRDYDGMTIQEHVRRAVDEYLDRTEAKYARRSSASPAVASASGVGQSAAQSAPSVTPLMVPVDDADQRKLADETVNAVTKPASPKPSPKRSLYANVKAG